MIVRETRYENPAERYRSFTEHYVPGMLHTQSCLFFQTNYEVDCIIISILQLRKRKIKQLMLLMASHKSNNSRNSDSHPHLFDHRSQATLHYTVFANGQIDLGTCLRRCA